jgi:hypothetical protein
MKLLDSRVYVLHEFSGLKEFVISVKYCPLWNLADILPTKSATTLTSFSYNGDLTHKDEGKFDPLKSFTHLTHLNLSGISWQFCRYLSQCPFHLETFKAQASHYQGFRLHRRPLAELWTSGPFINLKHLALSIHFSTPKASIYGAVIQGITQLSNLETLDLTMPLEWAWCPHFSGLGKLKRLKWSTKRKEILVNGKKPKRENANWKHKFKQRFRTYLPASCRLDFSITVIYSYHDGDSDWWDYEDEYSAFTDSDWEVEWTHDVQRPKSNMHDEKNLSSASKRKKYGRHYSTNSWDQEEVRQYLQEPESSSGFESCDDSDTYHALCRKRHQRKLEKVETPMLGIKSALYYSGDESDPEEKQIGRGKRATVGGTGRGTGRGRGRRGR